MKLHDALREECVSIAPGPKDKASALRYVAHCAKQSAILRDVDEDEILRGLEEREALGTTGFGKGIAIPHCRLEDVPDFVVGLVTVPEGVDFEAMDGKQVDLIVFIVAPAGESNEHIRLLSAISQALHGKGVVREIVSGKTIDAVRESFLRHARGGLDTEGHTGKHLIHVFVQDEDLFQEIVQVFAEMEENSVSVITSENLASYYGKVPLFQGLWSHEPGGFSQVIVAVAEKGLTNETVRRIETITGDLDKRTGVLVTVQEIFYAVGSLAT